MCSAAQPGVSPETLQEVGVIGCWKAAVSFHWCAASVAYGPIYIFLNTLALDVLPACFEKKKIRLHWQVNGHKFRLNQCLFDFHILLHIWYLHCCFNDQVASHNRHVTEMQPHTSQFSIPECGEKSSGSLEMSDSLWQGQRKVVRDIVQHPSMSAVTVLPLWTRIPRWPCHSTALSSLNCTYCSTALRRFFFSLRALEHQSNPMQRGFWAESRVCRWFWKVPQTWETELPPWLPFYLWGQRVFFPSVEIITLAKPP